MKAVLIAIKPKWVELILRGIKTIEVRKTFPNLIEPFVVYIYVTRGTFDITLCDDLNAASVKLTERARGKVVGEFICKGDEEVWCDNEIQAYYGNKEETCVSDLELRLYATKGKPLHFWNISDLKIYDQPKELDEFKYPCQRGYNDMNTAWCYRERGVRLTMCRYNDMKNGCCNAYLTNPPQSWCYVEA